MSVKKFLKSVAPAPLWAYLRERRARARILSAVKQYMKSSSMEGFIVLKEYEEYGRTGKIFGGEQYYSQAYQDYFLDKFIFCKKEGGFFLDIGGNDPVNINNTYFFEKNRGWTGLAFEPMPEQRGKWKTARTTECLPCALGSKDGETEFCEYEDHAMSGFSDDVDYGGKVKSRWKVPVRRLSEYLRSAA